MACFVAPVAEAIVVSVIKKVVEKKEKNIKSNQKEGRKATESYISWGRKLSWLNTMLWGGAFLLMIEHIWYGEIVFYPPFLTEMNSTSEMIQMFHEIAQVGTSMSIFITVVWAVIVVIAETAMKHKSTKIIKAN